MNFNFLTPVSKEIISFVNNLPQQALGRQIKIHSTEKGIPNINEVKFALIGVNEHRNSNYNHKENLHFDTIREAFYALFPGNWDTPIADLGDILQGASVEDTYFALKTTVSILYEKNVIPIILGGSQDLTYAQYRAYDNELPMVNIVNIDTNFDLGDANLPIKNNSYVGKIIVDKPYNLFNYTAIGYQTYFNSQEELDLMEKLYFESYRLGEVANNIHSVEPLLRDADIVSIDLKSVKASDVSKSQQYSPNGFSGKQMCAIARYAGISNRVSSIGIYEYKSDVNDALTEMLIAQVIWYFIEGVNWRVKDEDFQNKSNFQKFNVLVENTTLVFYKNLKTKRWWIEIPFLTEINNKLKKHTLLPCTEEDYLKSLEGLIPERWFKASKKNNF